MATLASEVTEHVAWLEACRFAAATVRSRRRDLVQFARWCNQEGLKEVAIVSAPDLERYRLAIHQMRKANGDALSRGSSIQKLLAVKQFVRWAARMHMIANDIGADIALPRQQQRLPRSVLSAEEVERVLAKARGLRDRAILETLYSTGARRTELIELKVSDLDPQGGVLFIRNGKGAKDRVVPLGRRALGWIERYLLCRPALVRRVDPGNLFLTSRGRPLRANRLSEMVHRCVDAAALGKTGSCHLFRHTMATLMLDHGADIRYIQEILGHAQLTTTELYTRVSITRLKEVHLRTHPANLTSVSS